MAIKRRWKVKTATGYETWQVYERPNVFDPRLSVCGYERLDGGLNPMKTMPIGLVPIKEVIDFVLEQLKGKDYEEETITS